MDFFFVFLQQVEVKVVLFFHSSHESKRLQLFYSLGMKNEAMRQNISPAVLTETQLPVTKLQTDLQHFMPHDKKSNVNNTVFNHLPVWTWPQFTQVCFHLAV